MDVKVLVKDYGRQGLAVFGVTTSDNVVNAWEAGDTTNRHIATDTDNWLDGKPLAFEPRKYADDDENEDEGEATK